MSTNFKVGDRVVVLWAEPRRGTVLAVDSSLDLGEWGVIDEPTYVVSIDRLGPTAFANNSYTTTGDLFVSEAVYDSPLMKALRDEV